MTAIVLNHKSSLHLVPPKKNHHTGEKNTPVWSKAPRELPSWFWCVGPQVPKSGLSDSSGEYPKAQPNESLPSPLGPAGDARRRPGHRRDGHIPQRLPRLHGGAGERGTAALPRPGGRDPQGAVPLGNRRRQNYFARILVVSPRAGIFTQIFQSCNEFHQYCVNLEQCSVSFFVVNFPPHKGIQAWS